MYARQTLGKARIAEGEAETLLDATEGGFGPAKREDGQDHESRPGPDVSFATGDEQQPPVIRCMNVKYSPNLGDGLLAECLEEGLILAGAGRGTSSIDLAARETYGESMTGRQTIMAGLAALPGPIRSIAVRAPLALASRRRWAPHYASGLAGADAIVIGGGNLLSDHDLNFPTKVGLAINAAKQDNLPVAIFGCGMSGGWSAEGKRRMRRALTGSDLRAVFLRDEASAERWDDLFADVTGVSAKVVRDPGLLARDIYSPDGHTESDRPVIGVGIMSQLAVRYHSKSTLSGEALSRWYVDLVRGLIAKGARVIAFTNGAPEDRATYNLLKPTLIALGAELEQPGSPRGLSDLTAGCDAVVAFRMHALVAAYSHAVPILGLRWDKKVDAFMASIDRSEWVLDPASASAEETAELALQAAREGVDPIRHDEVVALARDDVRKLMMVF